MIVKNIKHYEELDNINLDYQGENRSASFLERNNSVLSYPAKLVPQLVADIIKHIANEREIKTILDPFVGSGTTALEANYLGFDFYGTDLNPLAILIAKTKVLILERNDEIIGIISDFLTEISIEYKPTLKVDIVDFKNIDYWFKKSNIHEISYLKNKINLFIEKQDVKLQEIYSLILLSSLSSCIKASSLSRNSEFKLYRMSPSDIEKFQINSIEMFENKVNDLLDNIINITIQRKSKNNVEIRLKNAKNLDFINEEFIDLVITSPPYGDSRSTVAYGQFSRLSIQWLGDLLSKFLSIPISNDNCDELLLGGKYSSIDINEEVILNTSDTLRNLFQEIDLIINEDLVTFNGILEEVNRIIENVNSNKKVQIKDLNEKFFELIDERVRLDYVRRFNKEAILSKNEIKSRSVLKKNEYIKMIFTDNFYIKDNNIKEDFIGKIGLVRETVKRKIISTPKRKDEILKFFKDLFVVVLETDRVLKNGGIQTWVVGHRTIFGKIQINMKEILLDWFISLGYIKISDLSRDYSFKRLPHHINSTVNRNDRIPTMMKEHILIVQKNKEV
ncbi:site-specific DNA-methyltransferase [Lysinibacillus piscis]|uniref:site-specific DNA-methyltransferase (cytosine-N(4)-specific) n=1 Tax=Lysinibacillus piscis TaxID=2518931 RepID=A0ABQ5NMU5_9BACI|nr:site-specific DNA-methyltransferase [Lysinibacillus sp. KH24]GLC89701.1 hypothetical protein LYSBPC_28280 [Lysinibacillus sp. KH24]